MGYKEAVLNNVIVTSAKEVVTTISFEVFKVDPGTREN